MIVITLCLKKSIGKYHSGLMVIPRKNIGFSSSEPSAPRKKIQYFSSGSPSPLVVFSNTFFQTKGNTPIITLCSSVLEKILGIIYILIYFNTDTNLLAISQKFLILEIQIGDIQTHFDSQQHENKEIRI